jgi:PAS domain S-box-containing protein
VIIVDADGRIAFANAGLHRLFGYEEGALLGEPVGRLTPLASRSAQVGRLRHLLESGTYCLQGEGFVARRKNGTEFSIAVSLHRSLVDEQPVVLCFVTDLEKRYQSAERLRELQEHLQRTGFEAASSAEQERRRLATELHDGLGQSLVLASMQLKRLDPGTLSPDANAAIAAARKLLDEASAEARAMTFELSPPVLYDLGLGPALSWLVEEMHRRHGQTITLIQEPGPYSLHEVTASVIFRSVRELLMNALKYAGTGQARVEVILLGSHLEITVQDDGAGFDARALFSDEPRGFGLHSVREQLSRVGGSLEVASAPGQGTSVTVRVHLPPSGEESPRVLAR